MNNTRLFYIVFMCMRVVLYILIVYMIYRLLTGSTRFICNWNEKYGILCPSCGATRATLLIIKGQFLEALKYNTLYVVTLFPLSIFLIADDIIIMFARLFKITKKRTLIEILLEVDGEVKYGKEHI